MQTVAVRYTEPKRGVRLEERRTNIPLPDAVKEQQLKLSVFTDLDGTLLDHDTYRYDAAKPALDALRALGVPVILSSSKTAAEMAPLHDQLDLGPSPIIAENGAQLVVPGTQDAADQSRYHMIRTYLDTIAPDLRRRFAGFGDMDVQGVIAATGLDDKSAQLAKQRCHSEPGIWSGTDEEFVAFESALKQLGVDVRRGGRFATLSFGATKADRMRELIAAQQPASTIALGDAPNDIEMIDSATHGVIVRNEHGPGLPRTQGEIDGRVRRTADPGPAGWNTAVLDILNELGLYGGER